MRRHNIILSSLALVIIGFILVVNNTLAYCPPYYAFVDEKASNYPNCLKIRGYMACGGDLEIRNKCSYPLVVDGRIIPAGETEYSFKEVEWRYESPEQNIQKWVLSGDLNGEEVLIKGQTENWSGFSSSERFIKTIPLFDLEEFILIFPLQYKVAGVIVIVGLTVSIIIKTVRRNN